MLELTRHEGGSAGTIVLLHSLALDRSVWDDVIPHLVDRFDVVAVDLPNHGRSPSIADTTVESLADEVADFIGVHGFGAVVLIGMSLGGCVAQAVAVRHPHLVSGLGLVDTTCWYGPTAPDDWEQRAQRAVNEGLDSLAEFQIKRWFSPGFGESQPRVVERLLEVFRANDLDDYVATCRALGAVDLRDVVGQIGVPTSIIVGELDPATPPSHAEDLRQRIWGAGLHVVPGVSHLSPAEHPQVVAGLLAVDLFERLAPTAARGARGLSSAL